MQAQLVQKKTNVSMHLSSARAENPPQPDFDFFIENYFEGVFIIIAHACIV